MGNSSYISSFEENNFRRISGKQSQSILYNDITKKSVEQHQALLNESEQQICSLCEWRSNLPEDSCIVDLYEYGTKSYGICSGFVQLYVITERIYLLQNIGTYSKAEAFLIIRDVSHALRILFKKFGPFSPKLNTMGINCEGKAKLWVSQNFAYFDSEDDKTLIQTYQLGVINKVITLISSKVYNDNNFPINYPLNLTFESAQVYCNDVLENLKGFKVDRVYLDRTQFNLKYKELREREEKEERSRLVATEAERKLRQISYLHQKLLHQQQYLQKRQHDLRIEMQYHQSKELKQQQRKGKGQYVLVNTNDTNQKYVQQKKEQRIKTNLNRPPLPPRKLQLPQIQNQIQMVDSLILSSQPLALDVSYEESRIIRYKF